MKLSETSFTVFDLETTGLYPASGDKICEIGALRVDPGGRKSTFHSLVDPVRPISYGAFRVNRITREMVCGQPHAGDILPDFVEFIKGSVLVAYNAGFDLGFLQAELEDNGRELEGMRFIDALILARKLFAGAGKYNLANIAEFLEISVDTKHRAMADVLTTWSVFEKELGLLKMRGVKKVEDISGVYTSKKEPAADESVLSVIRDAIKKGMTLNITYKSLWNEITTNRSILPIRIDESYIIAYCQLRKSQRTFRLDCIIDAK
ncbi:MAG: exonuclease domain-containing protein [Candidatus Omnitrophota bacterium]